MKIETKKILSQVLCLVVFATSFVASNTASPALAQSNEPYEYTQIIEQNNIELNNLEKEFFSPEIKGKFNFNSLVLSWQDKKTNEAHLNLKVQVYNDNVWSKWYDLEPTIDGRTQADFDTNSTFFVTQPASALRYQMFLNEDERGEVKIEDLKITLFNATPEPQNASQSKANSNFLAFNDSNFVATTVSNNTNNLKIITRKEWGANESLNVSTKKDVEVQTESNPELSEINKKFADELKVIRTITKNADGKELKWPLEYPEKVKKIIIHHTATSEEALVASTATTDKVDYKQIVKNIQYYHAVNRGWGDIGYNYLVDPDGNIYEGRYGEAIGAHAAGSNHGSLGISVIGNYQEKQVPSSVLNSIVKLSANKAKKFDIQPDGKSSFRGEMDFNILGHRDVTATACPGQNLYALLPTIRKLTATAVSNEKSNLDFEFSDSSDEYAIDMNRNETKKVTVKLKNIGKKTWDAGSYLSLDDSTISSSMLSVSKAGGVKLAIMKEGSVAPGKIATFEFSASSKAKSGMTELDMTPFIKSGTQTNKIDHKIYLPVFVNEPIYTYELVNSSLPVAYVKKGTKLTNVWVELKNTGNVSWSKKIDAVVLGADGPRDRSSSFIAAKPSTRMAYLMQDEVKPGEIGRFNFNLQAPNSAGQYTEYFTPVVEGITWMKDKKMKFSTYVYNNEYEALISNLTFNQQVKANQESKLKVTFKNAGGVVWKKGSLSIDVSAPTNFKVVKQEIQNKDVKPGESLTATITVKPSASNKNGFITIMPKIGSHKLLTQAKSVGYKIYGSSTIVTPTVTSPTTVSNISTAKADDNIRVKIGFDGNPTIKASAGMDLYDGKTRVESYTPSDKVQVTYEKGKYQVRQGTSTRAVNSTPRFVAKSGGYLEIVNFTRGVTWNKDINDNKFRGVLEIIWDDNKLVTVNDLPIEDYLKGLAENANDEKMEKMKALIVAARTYAKYYTTIGEKFAGKAWHLDDDPAVSQKYLGYGYEMRAPRAVEAVKATTGEVIKYQGTLIKTPYFSQSAGRTLSAQEVWGWKDTPYLKSVTDSYCKETTKLGHGVGLSGCGARGMADAGKSYIEILKYFYTGVEVGK